MPDTPKPLFSFAETDHLMRIHLRLGLEDLGFRVAEENDRLSICKDEPAPPPQGSHGIGRRGRR